MALRPLVPYRTPPKRKITFLKGLGFPFAPQIRRTPLERIVEIGRRLEPIITRRSTIIGEAIRPYIKPVLKGISPALRLQEVERKWGYPKITQLVPEQRRQYERERMETMADVGIWAVGPTKGVGRRVGRIIQKAIKKGVTPKTIEKIGQITEEFVRPTTIQRVDQIGKRITTKPGRILEAQQLKRVEGKGYVPSTKAFRAEPLFRRTTPLEPPAPKVRGGLRAPKMDFTKWKDKMQILLSRETLERNISKVAGKDAPKLQKFLIEPIRKAETARINLINKVRQSTYDFIVKRLGIRAGSKEDALIQKYGEKRITIEELKRTTPKWRQVAGATKHFKRIYNDLLSMVNKTRRQFGYKPIPKRKDYFRHFQELGFSLKQFGIESRDLPAQIAGLTQYFKSGKPFTSAELQRRGGPFTESAIRGLDNYLDSVTKQIFHTESIWRARAVERYLRETSKAGVAELPKFTRNITQYGDFLANKLSGLDRGVIDIFDRGLGINFINTIKQRTSANLIAGNVSSALTNYIPITQLTATTNKKSVIIGLFEALKTPFIKDMAKMGELESGFIRRRFPIEIIDPTKMQKGKAAFGWLFKSIDRFVGRWVVAAKYSENLAKGISKLEALRLADNYAGRVMADRSVGQLPNMMNVKTLGIVTQFQTEINNMFSFLSHDIPKMSHGNKLKIMSSLTQFAVYSYLFNNMYEYFVGRRPTIDPIQSVLTVAGLTDERNKPAGERVWIATKDLLENIPFTGGITGGRFPISAGIPDIAGMLTGKKVWWKEATKPVAALLPPFGGMQVKKTIEGLGAYAEGLVKTPKGAVKVPVEQNTMNFIRGLLFGAYSFPEIQRYYDTATKPLGEKQTTVIMNLPQNKRIPFYNVLIERRKAGDRITDKVVDEILEDIDIKKREIDKVWPELRVVRVHLEPKIVRGKAFEKEEEIKFRGLRPTIRRGSTMAYTGDAMALIKKYFPRSEWENAYQVMMGESGGNPEAVGDTRVIGGIYAPSVGLFQIRTLPGRPSAEQLKDPEFNVRYAAQLWRSQGWNPWSYAKKIGLA